jgi:dienelactone hydrolase
MAIQQVLERVEWAHMLADAAAFAPYLRKAPLASRDERPVIVLFAKGDQQVPNPATTAILRAGDLADRAIYYRTDQAVNAYGAGPAGAPPTPPPGVEKDGHIFLNRQNSPTRTAIARAAQEQVAVFFASDGQTVIDPNPVLEDLLKQVGVSPPPEPLFEAPIAGPLPEDLNFIP